MRLVRETGKPIAQVARDLGVNEGSWATGLMLTGAAGTATGSSARTSGGAGAAAEGERRAGDGA